MTFTEKLLLELLNSQKKIYAKAHKDCLAKLTNPSDIKKCSLFFNEKERNFKELIQDIEERNNDESRPS